MSDVNRHALHDRATQIARKSITAVSTTALLARGVALLLHRSALTRYDMVPDDAAVMDELFDRGVQPRATENGSEEEIS